MLTLRIHNDGTGTRENSNYRYFVFVNGIEIDRGEIDGHNRDDGWASLIRDISEKHLSNNKKESS